MQNPFLKYNYIAIEGNIGAGKTTLCNMLTDDFNSKLILEAPFASFEFMAQDIAKVSFAGSFYGNLKIDNSVEIQKVQQPFMWMHGTADDFVGIHHGELIQQNYQGTHKVVRRVSGGEHSTVPIVMGFDIYMKLVVDFITGEI